MCSRERYLRTLADLDGVFARLDAFRRGYHDRAELIDQLYELYRPCEGRGCGRAERHVAVAMCPFCDSMPICDETDKCGGCGRGACALLCARSACPSCAAFVCDECLAGGKHRCQRKRSASGAGRARAKRARHA